MPFKLNQVCRHHIPRQKHRVTNSAVYDDAALRQRGSLTIWVTDEAIADWRTAPRTRRNGEPMHLLVDSTGLRVCGAGEWCGWVASVKLV